MIVGACGFGSTGSSVVTDYLKEFDNFQVLDKIEFTWVSAVDGLIDLDYHLNNPHSRTSDSIIAIDRYKRLCSRKTNSFIRAGLSSDALNKSVNDFLNSIILTSWKWEDPSKELWPLSKKAMNSLMSRLHFVSRWEIKNGRQWNHFPYSDVYFSVMPENFLESAKKHVNELLVGMGADLNKPIILDQPFAGNNPEACFKFYDDPYAIVVDRDPRDNYVFARTKLLGKWHFMPVEPVREFVKYYRAIRKKPNSNSNGRILNIRFEDMVYHYEETTKVLRDFLHLPNNPNPKSIFDPAISMPNTQVWKRFPQFAKEIEYIEKELPEYLFDYNGCPEPNPNGEMFYGKSPKNKN